MAPQSNPLPPLLDALGASQGDASRPLLCQLAVTTLQGLGAAILAKDAGGLRCLAWAGERAQAAGTTHPAWLLWLANACDKQPLDKLLSLPLTQAEGRSLQIIAVPMGHQGERELTLCICLDPTTTPLHLACDVMQILAAWQRRHQQADSANSEQAPPLLEAIQIQSLVLAQDRFFAAATTLCSALVHQLKLERVVLGSVHRHDVTLLATDLGDGFTRNTSQVRLLEQAMTECMEQDCELLYPAPVNSLAMISATRELAQHLECPQIISLPLRQQGKVVLVLLVCGQNLPAHSITLLRLIAELLAPYLQQLRLHETSLLGKSWRQLHLRALDLFGPNLTLLKLGATVSGVALLLSLLIQGDWDVQAPLRIEGTNSYTHTAPVDSFLTEVHVRPGDAVHKGDLLGKLDTAEIRAEISSLSAEYQLHENQAAEYQQEGKTAEAALSELDAQRIMANLQWAKQKLRLTELRANADGYLISEDMYSRIGQPVRRGQELFEIADTRHLRAIMQVSEADISDFIDNKAIRGEFALLAYPSNPVPLQIERIQPFAAVIEGANTFEVRGVIGTIPPGLALRPGMEGEAHLVLGKAPLLYLWTSKLINHLRMLWWKF